MKKDLIIVVADSYQEKVMEALMPRIPFSSDTRQFSFEIIRNIGNDSGSYNDSHELLRPYIHDYEYTLVIFDYEGSGIELEKSCKEAELIVEGLLSKNGWNGRNATVIIEPELENWIWVDNPNVENAIGWEKSESLYNWAKTKGFIGLHEYKPKRPKESLEEALRICRTAKSSAIYKKIASHVSYNKCNDRAFIKLITTLKEWFPKGSKVSIQ